MTCSGHRPGAKAMAQRKKHRLRERPVRVVVETGPPGGRVDAHHD